MFASDRDLLVYEPNLFRDVGWVGQTLIKGTGNVSGTTLTITGGADANLLTANVATGYVVLVGGTPYEIVSRLSGSTATISRLRDQSTDAVRPPTAGTALDVMVMTFRPQIQIVHEQVLRMLGIEPNDPALSPADPLAIGEDKITNPGSLARVEALGALHLIYAAAAAPGGDLGLGSLAGRAQLYRDRFARERQRVIAHIDTDGDGQPDATRRLNVIQFVRE
jgi:hypothetical protein